MVEIWNETDSKLLGDFRIFQARQVWRESPRTGNLHTFYVLESRDWMNVIPLTPQGNVVMIRQYRHGTQEVTLEVPGGIVDDEDGEAAITAARELREETGYVAREIIPIGRVRPNPAFLNNTCYSFLALDAERVGPPELEGAEDIVVEEVPLAAVRGLVRNGRVSHSLTIAAFYHLESYLEGS
jgi:8-oxo-dGTP pyrophosphatase MutT (NUDIX family)